MKNRVNLSLAASALAVLTLAGQAMALPWYVARWTGAGGTSTDAANNHMASVAPSASGSYNLIDFTDPQNAGAPSNFALNNPIPGNTGGDDDNYTLHAAGILNVVNTGSYIFRSSADDGSRITLNGRNIVATDGCCGNFNSAAISLTAGDRLTVSYSYKEGGGGSHGELAVSNNGGATFSLLGQGSDGAFVASADFVVDQSFSAPDFKILPSTIVGPAGLKGSYYLNAHANQNFSTAAFLGTNPTPTGTFVSTSPNYHGAGTVAGHLGADGGSLTAGGGNSTDNSTFLLQGLLLVRNQDDFDPSQPGIQVAFRIGSDDNSRLKIGGFVIAENDGGHGFPHYSTNAVDALSANSGDNAVGTMIVSFPEGGYYSIESFYHNGGGGVDLQIFSSIGAAGPVFPLVTLPSNRLFQSAQSIPEPTTAMLGALGMGLLALRRRRAA